MIKRILSNIYLLPLFLLLFIAVAVLMTGGFILNHEDYLLIEIIGRMAIGLTLFALYGAYIYKHQQSLLIKRNQLLLLFTILIVGLLPSLFMVNTRFFLLMPLLLAVMIIAVMLNETLGIISILLLVSVVSLAGNPPVDYYLFYLTAGILSCLIINRAKERHTMIYNAFYMVIFNALMYFFILLTQMGILFRINIEGAQGLLFVSLNGFIAVILQSGSLPLWETLFDIVTPYKLLDLTNSDNKLLKRLLMEAPGTYHHSQMVANLAETAAHDIGANGLLARTGALYHDIGKLKAPYYFIENQNGVNPHDELAPDSSAKVIISHVEEGVRLAQKNKLPQSIVQIIKEHHGDSLVSYFFHKAKQHSDGFNILPEDFMYQGPKPSTIEAAIVMLADCVEAYVRSLSETEKNLDRINEVIDEIIKIKFNDNQLSGCDIKVKELTMIAKAFRKVYNGMYHERVKYPAAETEE